MKEVYAYTRVSTMRQGTQGSSLSEQKAAINRYASTNQLQVKRWFEERETAAKRGRPVFSEMFKLLERGQASGVIIHKIDRSARNLKDWADLGELVDRGIEIHLAHESLDMQSRGGRLAADIQAVVAADYIRNLRQEVIKGVTGRLKQGLWPWPAPPGYLNNGGGQAKTIDPYRGPMVQRLFELYASGHYSLRQLVEEARLVGLRGRNGAPLSRNGISTILNNVFYTGVLRHKRTNETFVGVHEPLISPRLFQEVQSVLQGKHVKKTTRHQFTFRGFVKCANCQRFVTGERQKGHIYYRCHNRLCPSTSVREELLSSQFAKLLQTIALPDAAAEALRAELAEIMNDELGDRRSHEAAVKLAFDQAEHRLRTLTDRYLDGDIDRDSFLARKETLVEDHARLRERMSCADDVGDALGTKFEEFFELQKRLSLHIDGKNSDHLPNLVQQVSSNRTVNGKKLLIDWKNEFQALQEFCKGPVCGPERTSLRTFRDVRTIAECIFAIWKNEIAKLQCD